MARQDNSLCVRNLPVSAEVTQGKATSLPGETTKGLLSLVSGALGPSPCLPVACASGGADSNRQAAQANQASFPGPAGVSNVLRGMS